MPASCASRSPSRRRARAPSPVACLLALSVFGSAATSYADTPGADAKLVAESLFRDGRKLMDEGKIADGCRKLEESERLDPAAGTLLALATCHEREGRVATAWSEFTQSVTTARRDGRTDREQFAQEHLKTLEPQLPRVVIDVPATSRIDGLVLERNGTALTSITWGLPLPSDPGELRIVARAPGRKPWTSVSTVLVGDSARITVPLLEVETAVPVVASASGNAASSSGAVAVDASSSSASGRRTAAFVVGAAGIAALGAGTFFGIRALSKRSQSDDACPMVNGALVCTQAGVDANESARSSATVANIGIGVGIVAVAVAGYLFLTGHADSPAVAQTGRALHVGVAPDVSPQGGGAAIVGRF